VEIARYYQSVYERSIGLLSDIPIVNCALQNPTNRYYQARAEELRQYYEEQNRDLIAHITAKPPRPGTEAIRAKLRAERAKLESQA
jgi:hypothetical protein